MEDESSVMREFRGANLLDHWPIPLYVRLPAVNEKPRPIRRGKREKGGPVEAKTPERGVAHGVTVRQIVPPPHPQMSERTV